MPVVQQAQLERRRHAGYKVVIKKERGVDSVPCHETWAGRMDQWLFSNLPSSHVLSQTPVTELSETDSVRQTVTFVTGAG